MGMAELVVTAVVFEGRSKSEVARDYGISRRWVITLVQSSCARPSTERDTRRARPPSAPTWSAATATARR